MESVSSAFYAASHFVFESDYVFQEVLDDDVARKLAVILLSFVAFHALWLAFYVRRTSHRIRRKINHHGHGVLSIRLERAELATRMASTVNALILFVGGLRLLLDRDSHLFVEDWFAPESWPALVTPCKPAAFVACIACGYFLGDISMSAILYEEYGMQFLVHAAVSLGGSLYGALTERGLVFLCILYLWEGSTPFLNLRWWMLEYGYKDSILNKINGLLLVITFTLFRLVVGVPVLTLLVLQLGDENRMRDISLPTRVMFAVFSLAGCSLNIMWGRKLLVNFLRQIGVLKRRERKSTARPSPTADTGDSTTKQD